MPDWTVFSRPGCGLCEELLEELASVLPAPEAARLQIIDIDADPELTRKYASRITVLLDDGEFVCAYRLDRELVAAYL